VRLDILQNSIGLSSKKLLSFDFAQSFGIQFRASRYITRLYQASEEKFIVIWIFSELLFSIFSVLIYDGTQSDIRGKSYCCLNFPEFLFSILCISIYYKTQSDFPVKSYCHLNLLIASVFNFEHLELLNNSIGHPSQNLF